MVRGTLEGRLTALIKTPHHELRSDAGVENGGDGQGPSAHELVEAALASCTVVTCQLYANRKQWPLEGTDVQVEVLSESRERTQMRCTVAFRGPLSDEQRARLHEIAGRCPVHRLFESQIRIETVLAPSL